MAKPILFDTISRSKFDELDETIKAKRNYQIKEEDGSVSKHIAGLEGGTGGDLPEVSASDSGKVLTVDSSGKWTAAPAQGGGGGAGIPMFEFSTVQTSEAEWDYISVNTIDEINQAYEDNNIIGIKVDISLDLSSTESAIRTDYPKYTAIGEEETFLGAMFGNSAFDRTYMFETSGSYYQLMFMP